MKARINSTKRFPLARVSLLSIAIIMGTVGCSDETKMNHEDIEYLSHLDQSRFFQRQGELKASTLEARSAIDLQTNNSAPYFLIVENLIIAGDGRNAERQLNALIELLGADQLDTQTHNQIILMRAESQRLQGDFDKVLATLETLQEPSSSQLVEAELLKGHTLLGSKRADEAKQAYERAESLASDSALPLVGLSKVAYANQDLETARALIDKAEELDAQNPTLWLWKAQFAQSTKNWAAAEDAYVRALEDIGQYDVMTYKKYEAISALITVLRAQNKSAEAFVYEEILARSAPGTIKSNLTAAQNAFNNGDLDAAARYLEEVLIQTPAHEKSALLLGMIRFRQGRVEEAEQLLSALARQGESLEVSKLLAATKIQMHDPEGARELLDNLDDQQSDPDILALIGIASLASGDTNAGETFIERSLELNPDNQSLRLRYANYFAQQGNIDRALALASQVMEANPDANDARLLIIRLHLAANNSDAALESANAWVKEQPENIAALLTRGQFATQAGDPDEARRYFNQAATLAPKRASPMIALGDLARTQGNQQEAQEFFRKAVTLEPDNRQALQNLTASMERKDALAFMAEVLKKQPGATGPKLVLLEAALEDDDTAQADQLSADLLERQDKNTPAKAAPLVAALYNGIATNHLNADEPEKAAALLNRGRVLFPENENIALQSALLAFRQGDEQAAQETIREAKRLHPDSARPFITEAGYLASEGKFKDAAELYQLALEKQDSAATVLAYTRALQESGQPEKAVTALTEATTRFPDQPDLPLSLALLHQGADQPDKAGIAYEQVLELAPNNVLALNNLAWIHHENKDEQALALAKRAYELSPESGAVADTYGWILLSEGHFQESVEVLEKAYELQPDAEDIATHLVEAYKANGQEDKARQVLEKR